LQLHDDGGSELLGHRTDLKTLAGSFITLLFCITEAEALFVKNGAFACHEHRAVEFLVANVGSNQGIHLLLQFLCSSPEQAEDKQAAVVKSFFISRGLFSVTETDSAATPGSRASKSFQPFDISPLISSLPSSASFFIRQSRKTSPVLSSSWHRSGHGPVAPLPFFTQAVQHVLVIKIFTPPC
jgi:hypothetical protein